MPLEMQAVGRAAGLVAGGTLDGVNTLCKGLGSLAEGTGALMKKAAEDIDLGKVADSVKDTVTIPNVIKLTATLAGTYVGALPSAAVCTGLGFAYAGPVGAAIGYLTGDVFGSGAGGYIGFKIASVATKNMKKDTTSWRREQIIDIPYEDA